MCRKSSKFLAVPVLELSWPRFVVLGILYASWKFKSVVNFLTFACFLFLKSLSVPWPAYNLTFDNSAICVSVLAPNKLNSRHEILGCFKGVAP